MKRYIQISAGPMGRGVKVRLRELHTENEIVVTFSKFKQMEHIGQIEIPARITKREHGKIIV